MTVKRLSALTIALTVIASRGLQFALNGAKPGLAPWGARTWDLLQFFTILTCGLVAAVMMREAAGKPVSRNWHATIVVNIAMVGVIYQVLLAPPEPLAGLDWWPDFGFHVVIPVLTVLWWGAFGPKPLALSALPLWLIWPTAYCGYALIRGGIEGSYPYFFLDVAKLGALQVAINVAGLVTVFAGAGLVVWLTARLLPRSAV
ncbi:MAG: hypothetical protein B7Z31_12185 [Rhodobacterales bacterium 12-65-15]|nr:MAG: hypothetical protein B7Z31_12185 [Rhodobacterales bacterium 12-65-15]